VQVGFFEFTVAGGEGRGALLEAVTSVESTYERTMLHGVLQEELLVSDGKIAQTSLSAAGYHLDNGVRWAETRSFIIQVINDRTESRSTYGY